MKTRLAVAATVVMCVGSGAAMAIAAESPDHVDLPDAAETSPADDTGTGDHAVGAAEAERGEPASEVGQGRRAAAMTFVEAKKAWRTCVAEAAAAQAGNGEGFSPVEACGERPTPTLPEQAQRERPEAPPVPAPATGGQGRPANVPAGPPAEPPAGPPTAGPAAEHHQVPSDPGAQGQGKGEAPGGRP